MKKSDKVSPKKFLTLLTIKSKLSKSTENRWIRGSNSRKDIEMISENAQSAFFLTKGGEMPARYPTMSVEKPPQSIS